MSNSYKFRIDILQSLLYIHISITNKDNNRYVKILHNMLINDNFKAQEIRRIKYVDVIIRECR